MSQGDFYPEKFDLNDFNLPCLFSEVSITLDNKLKKVSGHTNYFSVNRLAKILRESSRELRTAKLGDMDIKLVYFLTEFYPTEKEKIIDVAREQAKELADLSEEFAVARELPSERISPLINLCNKLSKATARYWNQENPNGFKKY